MKRFILSILITICFLSVIQAAEQNAVTPVSSTISEVTVYSDRAQVTRVASIKFKKGPSVLAFQKLPGWIDAESIRVAVSPVNAGRITDVQMKRDYLARASDEDLRKAEIAVQEISDQISALDDELKILDAQRKQIESIRAFSLQKLPKDMVVREIDMDSYANVVNFVTDSLREIASARREIKIKRRDLQPELRARQLKLNELRSLTQLQESTVLITVESKSSRAVTLALTYMLPGATWEPAHELRAKGAQPKNVIFSSCAVVTQTTGEDWNGADISFSTQSPTKTIRIPELDALLIGNSRAVARLIGGQTESFQRAEQAYKGQNVLWYNYNNPMGNRLTYSANNLRQIAVQTRTSQVFKQLQQRGTTAHFKGVGKPTIRSDGRSIRVPIGEVTLGAKSKIVAAPQTSLNAARTVEMVNTGKQPLLPGKVSLYHNGAFLGMTDVEFISDGESFAVFLGVADQIKLSRTLDPKHSSIVRGKRTRMQIAFEISVENLSDIPASLSLADRIPVSENKEIEIDKVRIQPEGKPDAKGLLKWDLTLKPKEKRTFRIEYRIEYPPALVERIRRAKKSSAMPSREYELSDQINSLEANF